MIGYDLDGVISRFDKREGTILHGIEPNSVDEILFYGTLGFSGISLQKSAVIITGRPKRLRKVTLWWLKKYGIINKVYFCGDNILYSRLSKFTGVNEAEKIWAKSQAQAKSIIINKLKLDIYVDDRADIVTLLKKLCRKTQIILLNNE